MKKQVELKKLDGGYTVVFIVKKPYNDTPTEEEYAFSSLDESLNFIKKEMEK